MKVKTFVANNIEGLDRAMNAWMGDKDIFTISNILYVNTYFYVSIYYKNDR